MAKNTKKTKKITTSSIMKVMDVRLNEQATLIIGEGDDQIKISVKKRLNLTERSNMVNSIVEMVWAQDEDENYIFAPYLKKFAYDFNIINYFSDISLPDDINKVWEFVDSTNMAELIMDCVGDRYVDNIIREANEAIEYRKATELKRSKLDDMLSAITGVAKSFGDKTKNLGLSDLLNMIEQYAPEFKEEMGDMLREQMSGLAKYTKAVPDTEVAN